MRQPTSNRERATNWEREYGQWTIINLTTRESLSSSSRFKDKRRNSHGQGSSLNIQARSNNINGSRRNKPGRDSNLNGSRLNIQDRCR